MPRLAASGVLVFLLVVVVEHTVNRSLDPTRHEISEYVHTSLGWLMTAGFVVWSISLAITGLATYSGWKENALSPAFLASALGVGITACFATQTSAGRLPPGVSLDTSGRLHDIGSGLATVALVIAALLSLRLRRRPRLRRATIVLLTIAVSGDIVLLVLGCDVAGIRQRLLVVVGCTWQMAFLMLKDGDQEIAAQSR